MSRKRKVLQKGVEYHSVVSTFSMTQPT